MIKEYKVEISSNFNKLMDKVNIAIIDGWIPQGGICYSQETTTYMNERKGYEESDTDEVYMQAMILHYEEL